MIVECPKCHKKYEIDEMYIPIGGAPIRCPNCKNIFGIYVEPIDIPMTEVADENISAPVETKSEEKIEETFEKPRFGDTSITPEFQETKVEEEMPTFPDMDQFGKFSSEVEEIPFAKKESQPKVEEVKKEEPFVNPFAQPQQQKPATQPFQTPDFGVPPAFTQPKVEEVKKEEPFVNPFAQPQQQKPATQPFQTPDFGVPPAFTQPKVEEVKKEEPFVNPFAQPQQQKPATQPFQTPDFGVPPAFAQPKVEEVKKEEPFVNPFAQPQQQKPAASVSSKAGSPVFDVLLAGFNLPPDFKSLPENVQKAHKDAIKLARQLAKDILLYHKDDVERGLAYGNIKDVLKDEIEKSYKFYSQRIPSEIISSTNYFNEALNKIICKGQNIF
uniref:Zinc finger/thioredoxin putative domain-containing protein n=1 Tax=candidate division WOR-3 bacterium TaxID=2052148 RepID=A0A7C3J695_UNCW3